MERWCIVLDYKAFMKKNLRLLLFVVFVLGLIIYLFFSTLQSSSKTTHQTVNPKNPNEVVIEEETESSDEIVEEETIAEEETEDFMTDQEITTENRPSFVQGEPETIEGHQKITANSKYELYLKEENLSIILREKQSGAVMYSTVEKPVKSNQKWSNFVSSAVVIEYLVGTNIVYSQADMLNEDLTKQIKYTDSGFNVNLAFEELGFSFDVQVSLNDKGLQVLVPEKSLKEENDEFKIGNMYLYPFLGYSKMDEEAGYLLIPDGSGSLISLQDHYGQYSQPYSETIYGTNYGIDEAYKLSLKDGKVTTGEPNKVTAPVFGMVHTDKKLGFIGIIEDGDYSASIEAYPNGAILPYNWITSKFTYRQFFNQSTSKNSGTMVVRQRNRNSFDAKIQYNFVSGDDADYVGLAKSYREYLLSEQLINPSEEANQLKLGIDFLNADVKDGLFSDNVVAMTNFNEVGQIISQLQGSGVTDLNVSLKGWQNKGLYGGYAQNSFVAESKLGGNSGLKELLEKFNDEVTIYLYDDPLRFNPETQNGIWFNLANKLNKRLMTEEVHGQRFKTFNFLRPTDSENLFNKRLSSQGISNYHGLSIDGITNHLFSYSAKSTEFGRKDTLDTYKRMIEEASSTKQLMLQNPIQPFWQYADSLVNVPVHSSNYIFEDQEVPFFAIALKGLVPRYASYSNFMANKQEFKLKLIEQGINPTYLITAENPTELNNTNSSSVYSSKFENYEAEINEMYKELEIVNQEIGETMISNHVIDGDQVTVTYENGKRLLLNYSDQTLVVDGQQLAGYSYKVVTQ